mgnify:CR=1 FL=1
MGFGGISIWQLLIILLIVVVLFGTKKLKSIGADLGGAVKGFRGAMRDGAAAQDKIEQGRPGENRVIDSTATTVNTKDKV